MLNRGESSKERKIGTLGRIISGLPYHGQHICSLYDDILEVDFGLMYITFPELFEMIMITGQELYDKIGLKKNYKFEKKWMLNNVEIKRMGLKPHDDILTKEDELEFKKQKLRELKQKLKNR